MEMLTETQLMERCLNNARPKSQFEAELWVVVKQSFGVGSTHARIICKHYGFDPDDKRYNSAFDSDEEDEN